MGDKQLFCILMIFILCTFLIALPIVFSDLIEIVIEYEETGAISYEVNGVPINFGSLQHNTINNPATSPLHIANTGSVSIDVSIRAEDFVSGSYFIGIENCTYNTVNSPGASSPMSKSYIPISTVDPAEDLSLYFWVDVPEFQKALSYNSIIYINVVGV